MRSCSLFFFFYLFCVSVKLLQSYQIQPPGEPFWPRFYKPAPALPALLFYIYSLALCFCLCLQSETVLNICVNFWLCRTSACKS